MSLAEALGTGSARPAMEVAGLNVTLNGVRALREVNLTVPRGGQTVIIGPNGAGKTTFLLALLGQVAYSGRIVLDPPGAKVGYVPQKLEFDRRLPVSVLEFMALGLSSRPLWLGVSSRVRAQAQTWLEAVKAEGLAGRRLGELSGGELQRVLLAAALAQEPTVLILDEPSTGVDIRGEQLLCEILDALKSRAGLTQVVVSHDLATCLAHADWVVCLNHTVIAQGEPKMVITEEVLTDTFGQHQGLAKLPGEAGACTCPVHGSKTADQNSSES